MNNIIIGTRSSPLALKQVEIVKQALLEHNQDINFSVKPVVTSGDKNFFSPLYNIGGKGLFLKELEKSLLDKKIDFAIHSMKDVGVNMHSDLIVKPVLAREDPRDVLLSNKGYKSIADLPDYSLIGTSSPRRQGQLLAFNKKLSVRNLRGGIDTRISKLAKFDAIILAASGLKRLGYHQHLAHPIPIDDILPSGNQGVLAIQYRKKDTNISSYLEKIINDEVILLSGIERSVLKKMHASCTLPLGVYAESLGQDKFKLTVKLVSIDGRYVFTETVSGYNKDRESLTTEIVFRIFEQQKNIVLGF